MIYQLSTKYQKHIAAFMLFIFYASTVTAYSGYGGYKKEISNSTVGTAFILNKALPSSEHKSNIIHNEVSKPAIVLPVVPVVNTTTNTEDDDIGGPTQPEMGSFKPVDANNMVNLFTGDFSYNIPLLDVGGYPVNIFYDGNITPEQEASWVGLGWNINPGTVTRNMRGVPDDFDGTDIMTQTQGMKPNKTWNVDLGADVEVVGIKNKLGFTFGKSLGVSFNNYLGPAIQTGTKFGVNVTLLRCATSEKAATDSNNFSIKLNAGVSTTNSSRYGFTVSPNLSLSASLASKHSTLSNSFGISTSYNSRVGIRSLEISDQFSLSRSETIQKEKTKSDGTTYMKDINVNNHWGMNMYSTSISFAKPSYTPAIRMPITNKAGSGRFQIGVGLFGLAGSVEATVSAQKSFIADGDRVQQKLLYGYFNFEKANGNKNAVLDFTRLGDKEVTPTTPIISAPQYTYDVFSINGEGTGGSIRAYRNDLGYARDNETRSKDESWSVGADVDIPGHYGANFTDASTPSYIGEWRFYNKLRTATAFKAANGIWENVYFRNPGENSVLNPNEYDKIGGTDLVRYKIAGTNEFPSIEPVLEKIAKDGTNKILSEVPLTIPDNQLRKKRSQVVNFFSAQDASIIGLDKTIKCYNADKPLISGINNLNFVSIPRVSEYRKAHHISQINVTEADGKRYIYGIPVYNITQTDFTFTTASSTVPDADNHIAYNPQDRTNNSVFIKNDRGNGTEDGYVQSTTTPAYAHSFLLSGLLSPDYVDVTGDGITEDDLGNAVKFNYTKIDSPFRWRAPFTKDANKANYNPANRTEIKDNKGLITYGKRESWYTHSIESKTMIALFTLQDRDDAKSVLDEDGGIDLTANGNVLKSLKQIDLYSKADLKANGIAGAKPIKTVHFEYSYDLCKKTPDNKNTGGKLTLTKIYFTFNGVDKVNKNQYVFGYGDITDGKNNPEHKFNNSDRWGFCKPNFLNPSSMPNNDYPYTSQDKSNKADIDKYAAAWSLKSILLPSGGQIDVEYETDEYAFVQDKRASAMMKIRGLSSNSTTIPPANNGIANLYDYKNNEFTDNNFVFIEVPNACTPTDIYLKYFQGQKQLSFKLMVNMPKGKEYITAYGTIKNYGVTTNDSKLIWVELEKIDGYSPLALVAAEYLREQLPGQLNPGYDVSESSGLAQIGEMMMGWLNNLARGTQKPMETIREGYMARQIVIGQSFVRLNVPDGIKYGGGNRVKKVSLRDNWNAMTGQFTSIYGQEYDYSTTEVFTNGTVRTISSGVASYEPSIGGEENPFQTIVQISNSLPAGPTSYGSVEMPILDALFPAPSVGYSKVTVRSIKRNLPSANIQSHSGVGKQVTEFYTAKDFPVKYYNTALDPASQKEAHDNNDGSFFWSYGLDAKALSQGFYVETNDMHGKMKSQASYPENDENTPINFTQNFYSNTGKNEMNDKFDFVSNAQSGAVNKGNTGVDIELFTDTREFTTIASSMNIQGQVDWFPFLAACCWIPFVWGTDSRQDNIYKAVTCTKTVSYHSILDSVVVIDKGSTVSTKNLVYDAETGQVIVNRTSNEFNNPIYNTTYPAYWAYSGMGLAYKNIDAVYKGINFLDGRITPNANIDIATIKNSFESGDEVYLVNNGENPADACGAALATPIPQNRLLWVFDADKNTSDGLTNNNIDHNKLYFIDDKGQPFTKNNTTIRIVRSGKRNMLGATVQSITSMSSPIVANKLDFTGNTKVVNASEVEYKEKWQTDNDVFKRYELIVNTATCTQQEVEVCDGYLERGINPYCRGLLGTFRNLRSKVLYTNRTETNPTTPATTNIAANGFVSNFIPYWHQFNSNNNLINVGDANPLWVENSRITRINARGQELETKNALNIYTAAQYGYKKNLPLAIANNSKTEEMFYEGFEDLNYNGNINSSVLNCQKQHFSFDKMNNAFMGDAVNYTYGTSINAWLYSFGGVGKENVISTSSLTNSTNPAFVAGNMLVITNAANATNNKTVKIINVIITPVSGNTYYTVDIVTDATFVYEFAGNTVVLMPMIKSINTNLKAHTGNNILTVLPTTATNKSVIEMPIVSEPTNTYNLTLPNSYLFNVPDYGYNLTTNEVCSTYVNYPTFGTLSVTNTNNSTPSANPFPEINMGIASNGMWDNHCKGSQEVNGFINIQNEGLYDLQLTNQILTQIGSLNGPECPGGVTSSSNAFLVINDIKCKILYLDGSLHSDYSNIPNLPYVYDAQTGGITGPSGIFIAGTTYFKKGTYKIDFFIDYKLDADGGGYAVCDGSNGIGVPVYLGADIGCKININLYPCGNTSNPIKFNKSTNTTPQCPFVAAIAPSTSMMNPTFAVTSKTTEDKKMLFTTWVREKTATGSCAVGKIGYCKSNVTIEFYDANNTIISDYTKIINPSGNIIDGWQKLEEDFSIPTNAATMKMYFNNTTTSANYWDDIRIHPYNANMKSYVYDPISLRLVADLDENNYAKFYEYDDEGTLIRTKAETKEGIKTITETRSAKQKVINNIVVP